MLRGRVALPAERAVRESAEGSPSTMTDVPTSRERGETREYGERGDSTGSADAARTYDSLLGGWDSFTVDDELAREVLAANPATPVSANANRDFVTRAPAWLAGHGKVRQFLDIGSGIPRSPNLHEAVQAVDRRARVVYVDNSEDAVRSGQELIRGTPEGRAVITRGDLRAPERILANPVVTGTLDFSEPVAVCCHAVFQFFPDSDRDPCEIVRVLLAACPPGSYFVATHATADFNPEALNAAARAFHRRGIQATLRTREQFERFFDGLELLDPGIVPVHRWRPERTGTDEPPAPDSEVNFWAGVAVTR